MTAMVDSFTGPAADLKGADRTPDKVLDALRRSPRVSTWDMSEHAWLRSCLDTLAKAGRITEDRSEPYPWHRFKVVA